MQTHAAIWSFSCFLLFLQFFYCLCHKTNKNKENKSQKNERKIMQTYAAIWSFSCFWLFMQCFYCFCNLVSPQQEEEEESYLLLTGYCWKPVKNLPLNCRGSADQHVSDLSCVSVADLHFQEVGIHQVGPWGLRGHEGRRSSDQRWRQRQVYARARTSVQVVQDPGWTPRLVKLMCNNCHIQMKIYAEKFISPVSPSRIPRQLFWPY